MNGYCHGIHPRKKGQTMASNLTTTRAAHSRGVALYMRDHATKLGIDPEEAALCGWLHDFGYVSGDNRSHASIGGRLLHSQGYRHWREIATHGSLEGLSTPLGILLNAADMSVNSKGEEVGFEARLDDVAARYGKDSIQYHECSTVIGAIRKTAEWKSISDD